jgi:hypothetical protein
MQHRYVGDVGDFGKYGFLRALTRETQHARLGIIWYLTDPEIHNNDGKHDGYLKLPKNRDRQQKYGRRMRPPELSLALAPLYRIRCRFLLDD